jgi:hypothetical protein
MTATSPPVDAPVDSPIADLTEATAGLGRSRREVPIGQVLFYGGAALAALGVVAIILGWYGAAHTTRLYQQVPYMVSGGLLGLALVTFGGFAYFGYWLTRLVDDGRRQTDVLERIEGLLRDAAASAQADVADVVATPSGTMAHRADCSMVAGKANLIPVDPATTDLAPCSICQPF